MSKTFRAGVIRMGTVGVLALALVGVAAPGQATPPIDTWQETWDDTAIDVCDGGTADTSDDITIESHYVGSADFVVRERGGNGLFYYTVDGQQSSTYTNVDTGLYWTAVNRWHEKDLSITADDEGILTIRVGSAFFFKVYSADGIQGGLNVGRSEFTVVYDPATDTELSFTVTKDVGGRTAMQFCEDALRYTT